MVPKFPFQSVKVRLTLWYTFVLAILLSLFAFLMYEELARALYRDADKNLLFEVGMVEDSLTSYMDRIFHGVIPFQEIPAVISKDEEKQWLAAKLRLVEVVKEWELAGKRLSRSPLIVRLAWFDHSVLISNFKKWEREIIFPDFERDSVFMENGASFQTIHFQGRPIRLYYHLIRYKTHPLFIIQCGISLHEARSALRRLAFIIFFSIPGAVLAACLAGWFLAKRSFRPVDLMIREARQITAAYLKGRLPRSQAGDELDRLAETLNEMMDRIESSTRAVQEFSSDISHELKTPLAIIRGEIDLALRRSRSQETLVETLRVVESEVNELIRLVDDLMLLVRSDAKQLHFERQKISLGQILEQVVSRFQERAQAKKILLTLKLDRDAEIFGDSLYLKRLFSNLIDNAVKFTPEGGQVSLSLSRAHDSAAVEILDTGIGIELELQSKVFSRFYRTDQARSHEGAGLGLNIAKAISDAHFGAIRIESKPGQGTRVIVQFPLVAPALP